MSSHPKDIYGSIHMPEDVMIDILSRLPVKSLMRLRCVSKLWCTLIKNPNFISNHIKNYDDNNTHLVISYDVITDYGKKRVLSLFHDKTLANLSYQELCRLKFCEIFGPYDGIFCLCTSNRITLWNLATREYRSLPKCSLNIPRRNPIQFRNVGFGLDLSNNDYKVVFIRSFQSEKNSFSIDFSHFAVYTLSTDTWRFLNKRSPYHPSSYKGIYLNGILYWVAYFEDSYKKIILSFDMSDEEFQMIEMPYMLRCSGEFLGLYNDFLTVLGFVWDTGYFTMWVLKERIWIKQLTVGPILGITFPLGFWKNSGFFMESDTGELLLYDLSSHEVQDLGRFNFCASGLGISLHCYKESLVRIKEDETLLDFYDIPWHILGVYQVE